MKVLANHGVAQTLSINRNGRRTFVTAYAAATLTDRQQRTLTHKNSE